MPELVNTRCQQGKLIVTDSHIIVELYNIKSTTLARANFTALDVKWSMFGIPFLVDSRSNLTFHGAGGERVEATMVKTKDAKRIRSILTGR